MSTFPCAARRRPVALALAALLATALPTPALHAQDAPPARRAYAIAAGPLEDVLTRFAVAAGLALSFDPALVAGLTSAGLQGSHGTEEGLRRILRGSGLAPVPRADGSYTLTKVPAPAAAAPPASGSQALATVTVTANQLGEITEGSGSYTPGTIATATRLVLTPRETPQSISVVTREEMNDFNLTSIDKVMEHMPGVSIFVQDSERSIYYARGFAINTFQYDGIPMARNSAYSSGHALSDMAIYDRVEVLKGATGLLTGAGDPGATINLVRKKPTRAFRGEVALSAGSWDNYRTQLDLGGALNAAGSVRGRMVAAHQDKHSYQDGHQRRSSVLYGIVEADLSPSTLLTIGSDYQDNDPKRSSWGGIPLYDSLGQFNSMPRSFNNGARWSRWGQYTRATFATLEHHFDSEWVAKLQLNRQVNGYDAELAGTAAGNPDPATGTGVRLFGPSRYYGNTKSHALDVYASGPLTLLGRRHELVVGASLARRHWINDLYLRPVGYDQSVPDFYHWTGDAAYPTTWRVTHSEETTRENGVYATARLNLRDELKLIAGARVTQYRRGEIRESGVIAPYLGVTYDLDATHALYASTTSIFNPQSPRDEQGRTLDPLRGRNHEIGLKSSFFGGRLNASAALFQLDQDNYPELSGGTTPTGTPAYRAIDGVRTRGYELELSGQPTPRWNLHAAFSHKIARRAGEKVSTLTPENQFSVYANHRFAGSWSRLSLGGGARWQDKTWGTMSNPVAGRVRHTVGGYWLLDAMASYRFSDGLSASLHVNNLLDKRYYTLFDSYSTYTWGAPRSVNLSMNVRF